MVRPVLRSLATLGVAAGVLCAVAPACSSSDSETDPLAPLSLQLSLLPATDTIFITDTLTGAETVQLVASAIVQGQSVPTPPGRVFASQDPLVATVDSLSGLVRARSTGSADISVRVNGVRAHATIVVAHPTNRVLVTPLVADVIEDNAFTAADTTRMHAVAYGRAGTPLTGVLYTFSSSDPTVATIDAAGKVVAAKLGTTTITVHAEGMSATATVHAVRGTRSLVLTPAADTIFVDRPVVATDTLRVRPVARDSLNTIRTGVVYAFATAAPSVATVAPTGMVTAVDTGHTTVSVTGADLTASTPLAVLSLAKSVTLTAASSAWLVGDTIPLTATAASWTGSALTGRTYTYASGDARATISPAGRVVFSAPATGAPVTFTATTAFTTGSDALNAYPREYTGGAGALGSGMDATCGLLPLGRVYCFGRAPLIGVARDTSCFNDVNIPPNPMGCTLVPLRIASTVAMRSVAVGDSVACAISTQNHAYCWGDQTYGEVGNGIASPSTSALPALVLGPLGQADVFTQVAAGRAHVCALDPGGLAYCWGRDSTSQLGGGDGHRINSSTPIPVAPKIAFTSIVTGRDHSCALTSSGVAYCWGSNSTGQLGYGTVGDTSDIATPVPGPAYVQISAGALHTCGLTASGLIYCWGADDVGQSGHAGAGGTTPTQVPGSGYIAVAAGGAHTCALQSGGTAVCWGANDYGQLGRGTGTVRSPAFSATPTAIVGGNVFVTISAGSRTTCAVAADGAYCWGSSVLGAMGSQLQALAIPIATKTAVPQ